MQPCNHCVVKAINLLLIWQIHLGCLLKINLSQIYLPAVKVLAYNGPVDSTLPPLNPVWLTVKL